MRSITMVSLLENPQFVGWVVWPSKHPPGSHKETKQLWAIIKTLKSKSQNKWRHGTDHTKRSQGCPSLNRMKVGSASILYLLAILGYFSVSIFTNWILSFRVALTSFSIGTMNWQGPHLSNKHYILIYSAFQNPSSKWINSIRTQNTGSQTDSRLTVSKRQKCSKQTHVNLLHQTWNCT